MSKYEITHPDSGEVIGQYFLDPMPGCRAVGISHGLYIQPPWRGKGFGSLAHKERLKQAIKDGYEVLICTTQNINKAQTKILARNGWKIARSFLNSKNGHDLTFWIKHLTDPYLDYNEIGV